MNILFISTEAVPFAKSGGLGDVIGSLPKFLKEEGVDARVMLPLYRNIKIEYASQMSLIKTFYVGLAWRRQYCGIYEMEYDGVLYYFLDNEQYFNRDALYGYFDDGERFAYFSKACLDAVSLIDFEPDVLHCSEWQSALVPVYKQTLYRGNPIYDRIKTVFTIHNIEYQGRYNSNILEEVLGIPESSRFILDYKKDVDYMKGAIVTCDRLTTVSPTYAEEITYDFFASGLAEVIQQNRYKLSGILNGIDVNRYNPASDPQIHTNYTMDSIEKKLENKRALQRELGLEQRDDIPLISVVSRLVSHKGIELIQRVLDELMNEPVQLVILGNGEEGYENFFRQKSWQYQNRMAVYIGFSGALADRIYAGTDFLLMPSISEPCGLSQMIAMRYGTIPVVRETGGLKDSVQAFNQESGQGNGVTFASVNAHDMLGAIRRAIWLYHQEEHWNQIRRNAMESDFSWRQSSALYIGLYCELTGLPAPFSKVEAVQPEDQKESQIEERVAGTEWMEKKIEEFTETELMETEEDETLVESAAEERVKTSALAGFCRQAVRCAHGSRSREKTIQPLVSERKSGRLAEAEYFDECECCEITTTRGRDFEDAAPSRVMRPEPLVTPFKRASADILRGSVSAVMRKSDEPIEKLTGMVTQRKKS